MNLGGSISFLIFNIIVYALSFYFIIKKRSSYAISARSPALLILNNVGGFLMASIYITYEMVEGLSDSNPSVQENFRTFCFIIPNNYIITHMLFMLSFILRCHRIIACLKLNIDERTEVERFYKQKYMYEEKFYLKILAGSIIVLILANLFINLKTEQFLIIPYHFKRCMDPGYDAEFFISIIWIVINFIEHIVIITYTYIIWTHDLKLYMKFELCSFLVLWILYPNILRLSDLTFNTDLYKESHWTSYVCCGFLYICLIINGYFPIYLAYKKEKNNEGIFYHFNTKLIDNLYLFLSNEECLAAFYEYIELQTNKEEILYFLHLYTDIIIYNTKFVTEPNYEEVLDCSKNIYNKYFNINSVHSINMTQVNYEHSRHNSNSPDYRFFNDRDLLTEKLNNEINNGCDESHFVTMNNMAVCSSEYIENEILNKIKSNCQILNRGECNVEMFNEALTSSYIFLSKIFIGFRKSEEYKILIDILNLKSYIQCKMTKIGLIAEL